MMFQNNECFNKSSKADYPLALCIGFFDSSIMGVPVKYLKRIIPSLYVSVSRLSDNGCPNKVFKTDFPSLYVSVSRFSDNVCPNKVSKADYPLALCIGFSVLR